jgi:hypothetical protein
MERLSSGLEALSLSTNIRQQKTPESSNIVNQINIHRHARHMGPPPAHAKLICPSLFTLDNLMLPDVSSYSKRLIPTYRPTFQCPSRHELIQLPELRCGGDDRRSAELSSCVVLIRMMALLQVLKNGLDKPIQIALEILDADLLRGGRSRSQ